MNNNYVNLLNQYHFDTIDSPAIKNKKKNRRKSNKDIIVVNKRKKQEI